MQNVKLNPYDEAIKTFIKQEQTKHVLGLLKSTLMMQSIFVVACAFIFRNIVSSQVLILWIAAHGAIFLLRILATYWFFTVKKLTEIDTKYAFVTFILCIGNSLLWGISAFWMDFQQYPEESVLLITINLGIGVGSTGIGGYWFKYFLVYSTPYVCLFIASFLYGVPNPNITLGVIFALFAVFLTRVVYTLYHNNIDNLLLRRKNELLAKSRSNFLAAASHDLRQPLQALNLFISALKDDISSPKNIELLKKLDLSSHALNELLNQILDVSKLDSNSLKVEVEAVALGPILERLCMSLAVQAENKGLAFSIDTTSLWVTTDAMLIERLLANLLDNAVNYTDSGHVRLKLDNKSSSVVHITLEDSGIGISKIEQMHIFEEFYQVADQGKNSIKGVGLGLSIVKRICDRLNISMSLTSEVDEGTTFTLILPVAEPEVESVLNNEISLPCDFLNKYVLVIEDNDGVRQGLDTQLLSWGIRVTSVRSVSEALSVLQDNDPPDLVLSDYRLADNKTGIEAIESIKIALCKPDLPALVLSGDTSPPRLDEIQLKGYTLMHKPVKVALLRSMLHRKLNMG